MLCQLDLLLAISTLQVVVRVFPGYIYIEISVVDVQSRVTRGCHIGYGLYQKSNPAMSSVQLHTQSSA